MSVLFLLLLTTLAAAWLLRQWWTGELAPSTETRASAPKCAPGFVPGQSWSVLPPDGRWQTAPRRRPGVLHPQPAQRLDCAPTQ